MKIKLVLPYETILEKECIKITAPGRGGSFQIKPRHVDITWTLEPGILEIFYENDQVDYFALNQGVLVKQGSTVYISAYQAIKGTSLEALKDEVRERFSSLSKKEQEAQMILSKLESDTIRRLVELEK